MKRERELAIAEMCEHCMKDGWAKQRCTFRHSIDFSRKYPCKRMEGRTKWYKDVVLPRLAEHQKRISAG